LYQSNFNLSPESPFYKNTSFNKSQDNFTRLSHYESSFFFFLKRNHLYASLEAQSIRLGDRVSRPRDTQGEATLNLNSLQSLHSLLNLGNVARAASANLQTQLKGGTTESGFQSSTDWGRDVTLIRTDKTF
jgi:hypothetical protein